jgi:hypothetical protein
MAGRSWARAQAEFRNIARGEMMNKIKFQPYQIISVMIISILLSAGCSRSLVNQTQTGVPVEAKTGTPFPLQDQPTAAEPLVGPMLYPTPSNQITAWDDLIDPTMIAGITWKTYQGEIEGNDQNNTWKITFQYPAEWHLAQNVTPVHIYFQNMAEFEGPPSTAFAKFEVVRLNEPLSLSEGEIYIPTDFETVSMLGKPAVMYTRTDQPEQVQNFTISFPYENSWLVTAGYIYLPDANEQELNRYRSILFSMVASIKLEN